MSLNGLLWPLLGGGARGATESHSSSFDAFKDPCPATFLARTCVSQEVHSGTRSFSSLSSECGKNGSLEIELFGDSAKVPKLGQVLGHQPPNMFSEPDLK